MRRRDFLALPAAFAAEAPATDPRNIRNGSPIPKEGYCDQPYVVKNGDGSWLCVLTTGKGVEGQPGQHVVSTISRDRGRTWSPLVDIEPAGGPEASWVMPLKTPYGRVYAFYTYNRDNLRELENTNGAARRVDTLGVYAFKYSDDGGRTWSRERYEIPMRLMRIDRGNNYGGRVLFFWGVGKPIITGKSAIFGFAKVGKWGNPGTMVESQGCFLRSDNILAERDPRKIRWELLPDGDEGLRAPKGPVSDEANLVALNDGSLYATYRTIDGYNCHAYSRDGGHTWTPPAYATYGPGARRIKHPRAANFVKKFSNGKYLLWYHNHGGEPVHASAWEWYAARNPAWVAGGVERNGYVHWSEPEILLYDEDPKVRISYPDFIEDGGCYYVTETQKTIARVHEIDRTLLEGLWGQFENRTRAGGVLIEARPGQRFAMPRLDSGRGFTLDCDIRLRELTPGQTLLDAPGVKLATTARSTIELTLTDGRAASSWDCDPGTGPGTLRVGAWQHVTAIVEGGPKIVMWVIDGVLNDGGAVRQYGWGRIHPEMGAIAGGEARFAPSIFGEAGALRVYGRALRVSEAVGNWRAHRTD
ncbi:MAG: exo-alpha-sialidase [Bryobacteraceae bacterium]